MSKRMQRLIRRWKGVSHAKRVEVSSDGLTHCTLGLAACLPSLRQEQERKVIEACCLAAKVRFGCNLLHYSIQRNHMHLVLLAPDSKSMSRWAQGYCIRLAKALNKLWGRSGKVWRDRFHSTFTRCTYGMQRMVNYVLNNARKHKLDIPKGEVDPYSSAPWYTKWMDTTLPTPMRLRPVALPWQILTRPWMMPVIAIDSVPGPKR